MDSAKNLEGATQLDIKPAGPELHVVPPPAPDAAYAQKRRDSQLNIKTTLGRLDLRAPGVKVSPATSTSSAPDVVTTQTDTVQSMSFTELEKEIRAQEKILSVASQADQIRQELGTPELKLFRDQAGPIYNKLQSAGLLLPLAGLKQAVDAISQNPAVRNDPSSPEAVALRARNLILREAINLIEKNPENLANFDKGVRYLELNQQRDALQKDSAKGPVSMQSLALLRKTYADKLSAENAFFNNLGLKATGLIARVKASPVMNDAVIAQFDQEGKALIEGLKRITDSNLARSATFIIEDLTRARPELIKRLQAPQVAAQPPIVPSTQKRTPPPLPAIDPNPTRVDLKVPAFDTPINVVPKSVPTQPQGTPRVIAPQAQRSTPPPLPAIDANPTQPQLSVFATPTDVDLKAPVIDTPLTAAPQSIPTQLQGTPKVSAVNVPPVQPQVVPVSTPNTPSIQPQVAPIAQAPDQVPNPTVQPLNVAPERVVDLGALRNVLQNEAQSLIAQYPNRAIPKEIMAKWQSEATDYLNRQNRGGDVQLVLSMMTLFDAHNKQAATVRGRFGALKDWAKNRLNRQKTTPDTNVNVQPDAMPDVPNYNQLVDELLADSHLSPEDTALIKAAVSESLQATGTIDPEAIANKVSDLVNRRQNIAEQLAIKTNTEAAFIKRSVQLIANAPSLSSALQAMNTEENFRGDLGIAALANDALTLENSTGVIRTTAAFDKLMKRIQATIPAYPGIAQALQAKLMSYAAIHDPEKVKTASNNVPAQVAGNDLNAAELTDSDLEEIPVLLQEIDQADPDEALGAAIRHFRAEQNGSMVYALSHIDKDIDALFDRSSTNTDRIYEGTMANYLAEISQVLGKEHADIADALITKLLQRVKIQNQMIQARQDLDDGEAPELTKADIVDDIKGSPLNNNPPLPRSSLPRYAPRPQSNLPEYISDEEVDATEELADRRRQIENRVIQLLDSTEQLRLQDIIDMYSKGGEIQIAAQLNELKTAMPRVGTDNIIHEVDPGEIRRIGNQLNFVPGLSDNLRNRLGDALDSYLRTWNKKAQRDTDKRKENLAQAA